MAINVFGYENKAIMVYRPSNQPVNIPQINLLLIDEETEEGIKSHYVWIKLSIRDYIRECKGYDKDYLPMVTGMCKDDKNDTPILKR